jgi:hypothetical protein
MENMTGTMKMKIMMVMMIMTIDNHDCHDDIMIMIMEEMRRKHEPVSHFMMEKKKREE